MAQKPLVDQNQDGPNPMDLTFCFQAIILIDEVYSFHIANSKTKFHWQEYIF